MQKGKYRNPAIIVWMLIGLTILTLSLYAGITWITSAYIWSLIEDLK